MRARRAEWLVRAGRHGQRRIDSARLRFGISDANDPWRLGRQSLRRARDLWLHLQEPGGCNLFHSHAERFWRWNLRQQWKQSG